MSNTELLIAALINSLKILMVYASMQDGMLLSFVPRLYDSFLELFSPNCHSQPSLMYRAVAFFEKPLFACMTCMCSVWTLVFWFMSGGSVTLDILWLMLVSGGINYTLDCLFEFIVTLNLLNHNGKTTRH